MRRISTSIKALLFGFICVALSFSSIAEKQTIRASYYRQNVAPQLFFDELGRPKSGILFDLMHGITGKLKLDIEFLPIPRKRIEQALQQNIIDLHCVANPLWYHSQGLRWSNAIYENPDLLINRLNITSLSNLKEHKPIKIGTTLGYVYPELKQLIDDEVIKPVVSTTPLDSYKKYRKGKVSGFISASVEASYFNKELEDSVVKLNNNTIHCVYSPSLAAPMILKLNSTIEKLKVEGTINDILAKYKYRNQQESLLDNNQTLSDD